MVFVIAGPMDVHPIYAKPPKSIVICSTALINYVWSNIVTFRIFKCGRFQPMGVLCKVMLYFQLLARATNCYRFGSLGTEMGSLLSCK